MKRQPLIKQKFSSGNKIEIYLTEQHDSNFFAVDCEWENFPPSEADRTEYRKTVAPRILRIAARFRENEAVRQSARFN